MAKYSTIESWASRLGYVVERTSCGYVWHRENERANGTLATVEDVIEAILGDLKAEYGGGE